MGACFFVGQPLTTPQKKDCGLKMAVDDGSVFFGGIPLTQGGNIAGAVRQRKDSNDGVGNVAFNDSCINTKAYQQTPSCSFEDNRRGIGRDNNQYQ